MKRFRFRFLSRAPGLAVLWAALFLAAPSPAEPVEVGDLMKQMVETYSRLIDTIFMKPIKEIVETPFGEVKKDAETIARLAKELPHTEGNENNASFKELSDRLLEKARELERFADKKSLGESAGALAAIQGVCISCHGDFRF